MAETNPSIRNCRYCGAIIPAARIEAIANVTTCIKCAQKYPPKVDASKLDLSEASPINRNGFAPKD